MLVTVAVGVALACVGTVLFVANRRRRDARKRILQLAAGIDAVALSIEADVFGSPAERELRRLGWRAHEIAQHARSVLRRPKVLLILPGERLYGHEDRLHDDHGAVVQLRLQADLCLRPLREGEGGAVKPRPELGAVLAPSVAMNDQYDDRRSCRQVEKPPRRNAGREG